MSDDQNSSNKPPLKLEEEAAQAHESSPEKQKDGAESDATKHIDQEPLSPNRASSPPPITQSVTGEPEREAGEDLESDPFDLDDEDYDLSDDELDMDLQADLDQLSDVEADILDEEFSPDTDMEMGREGAKANLAAHKTGSTKKLAFAAVLVLVAAGGGFFAWKSTQTTSDNPVINTARVSDRSPYVAQAEISEESQKNNVFAEAKPPSQASNSDGVMLDAPEADAALLSPKQSSLRVKDVSDVNFSDFGLPQAMASQNEVPEMPANNVSDVSKIFQGMNASSTMNRREPQNRGDLASSLAAQQAGVQNQEEFSPTGVQAGIKKASPRQSEGDFFDSNVNRFTENKTNETARQVSTAKFIVVSNVVRTDNLEAQVQAANRALDMGYNDAAVEMFSKLYDQNPRDMRILMGYAVALQNTGQIGMAVEKYDEVLGIDENNAEAILNMLGLVKDQYPAVAARRLQALFKKNPNNPQIAAQLGITHAQLGDFDTALKYLSMAASFEPRNAQHLFNIAVIADKKGMKAEAVKYYEKALQVDSVNQQKNISIPRDIIYDRLSKLR